MKISSLKKGKILIAYILIIFLLLSCISMSSAFAVIKKGDINNDGVVNISDVTKLQKYLAGFWVMTDAVEAISDLDNNGVININDAKTLLKTINKPVNLDLPDYYNGYLETKQKEIENITTDNGINFAFITDLHIPSNAMNSKYLLKEVLDKNKNIPFAIFGGDIIGQYGDIDSICSELNIWKEYIKYVGEERILTIKGNHDLSKAQSKENSDRVFFNRKNTYNELFKYMENSSVNIVNPDKNRYYYFDIPEEKIRFVCLDKFEYTDGETTTNKNPITQNQYDWILETLSSVEDYTFIFIAHSPSDDTIKKENYDGSIELLRLLSFVNNKEKGVYESETGKPISFSYDFTDTRNEIACMITGHHHRDASNKKLGLLSICTTSDACYNDDPNALVQRKKGTVTEQAFDIFSIDTQNRTIKSVRIGGGVNREWNY